MAEPHAKTRHESMPLSLLYHMMRKMSSRKWRNTGILGQRWAILEKCRRKLAFGADDYEYGLKAFGNSLMILQDNSWGGKAARVYDRLTTQPWMRLIRAVKVVERGLAVGNVYDWQSRELSEALTHWLGNSVYYSELATG